MRTQISSALLIAAFGAQLAFGYTHRHLRVVDPVMPPVPGSLALDVMAFGDAQFLYRRLVFDLQNFGDTGGRFTRMSDYPVNSVIGWLEALDSLDAEAGHHLLLAMRYFGQTKDLQALDKIVRYVGRRADQNPERHSIWMMEAIYSAQVRLRNDALALQLGDIIDRRDPVSLPIVMRQMPAFLREKAGDYSGAGRAMAKVLASRGGSVEASEREYMQAYIDQMSAWTASPPAPGTRAKLKPPI